MSHLISKMVPYDHASYCSVPPLRTSSHLLLPPRLSRAQQAQRPRAPIRETKREVRESEPDSSKFAISPAKEADIKPDIKLDIGPEVTADPHQLTIRVAAIAIRPAGASAASSTEAQRQPVPNYRTQPMCHVPSARLGPADPPRKPGRPKGSKSRARIAAIATTAVAPPMRLAARSANRKMTARPSRS